MTNANTDTEPSGEAIEERIADGFACRDVGDDDDEDVLEIKKCRPDDDDDDCRLKFLLTTL